MTRMPMRMTAMVSMMMRDREIRLIMRADRVVRKSRQCIENLWEEQANP